ncbi:MAG: hypothetical protein ACFE9X_13430 [Promethearchaeota archaeon]
MKHKIRNFISIIFILLIPSVFIPSVLAKTRQSYLTSFIYSNEFGSEGFANANNNSVSIEATAYALDILDAYGKNPNDIETLRTNLEDNIKDMFDTDNVDLYNLYYLLKSLKILDHEIDTEYTNRIYKYINDTEQVSGGFSYSNSSASASISSTYYVIQIYFLINKTIDNITLHKNWVLSCNNSDGGYGGNQSLTSTLIDTYFTTLILYELVGNVSDLVDINMTLTYFASLYINTTADTNNFGGYLPHQIAEYAQLSSTYFCVKAISLISNSELERGATINWVLARQNFQDGGFIEITERIDQKSSSIVSTYYAFETLNILGGLSRLYEEIWMVEFNYWILIIILGSIGLIFGIAVYIYRKRRI